MSDFPAPPPPPPPNYAYVLPGHRPVGGFRSIGRVGRALVILQIISAASSALSVVALVAAGRWGQRFLDSEIDRDEFVRKIAPFLLASIVVGGVGVAVVVLQCIWSFRMAKNLPLLGRQNQTWAPAWGIAGWILAGCTLGIIPYLMHCELWKGSDPERAPGDPGWKTEPVDPLLHIWLASTVVTTALGFVGGLTRSPFGIGRTTNDLATSLKDHLPLNIAASLTGAAATFVLLVFVQRLTRRHMAATREF